MKRRSALLAIGVGMVCSFQGLAAQEKPIAIVHARIIDGIGGPPTQEGTVILRGSKIEYAGPSGAAALPGAAPNRDARGKSVMPRLAGTPRPPPGGWGANTAALPGS